MMQPRSTGTPDAPLAADSTATVIAYANRFEAVAADGWEGKPHAAALKALVHEVSGHAGPGLTGKVADALRLMARLIEETDPTGRFPAKVAILRDAAARLAGS